MEIVVNKGADVTDQRVPVVLLSGLAADAVAEVARQAAADPSTAVLHHDLREVVQGVVRRTLTHGEYTATEVLELAHGCVSCTLRQDLLPVALRLAEAPDVRRIVLHLDPALEPEAVCWALHHVVVDGAVATERLRVEAVVNTIDAATWFADAIGEESLFERGLSASADDERTIAQVVVAQVEFADAVVVSGSAPDAWTAARTDAVLDRLAPELPRADLPGLDLDALVAAVPPRARRGEVGDAHEPLLRGQPPLEPDCGISVVLFDERRPFHPARLHDALDVLLDGVVRTRGRIWVASQPDAALWVESAGGGLRVADAGPWLATREDWSEVDSERVAMASLRWDPYYGDREQQLVVITHLASPEEITAALHDALLTDSELAEGADVWRTYEDPFGEWHTDPCEDSGDRDSALRTGREEG
ncbi:GTPase, G3E family [Allokutzneria albata]|uniref:GTPase, G3E family n=1 Tax=Allokutzneria albata TaxID=211114 RepID=A0A1H0B3J4_ALLAB|nr:GTPase, G3E family [Allokutzneria albata]